MADRFIRFLFLILSMKDAAANPVTDIASNSRVSVGFPTAAPTRVSTTSDVGIYLNTTSSQYLSATSCTTEGLYQCLGGNLFQQCRYGNWSVVGNLAAEQRCTFHGEIEEMFRTPSGLLIEIVRPLIPVVTFQCTHLRNFTVHTILSLGTQSSKNIFPNHTY